MSNQGHASLKETPVFRDMQNWVEQPTVSKRMQAVLEKVYAVDIENGKFYDRQLMIDLGGDLREYSIG